MCRVHAPQNPDQCEAKTAALYHTVPLPLVKHNIFKNAKVPTFNKHPCHVHVCCLLQPSTTGATRDFQTPW